MSGKEVALGDVVELGREASGYEWAMTIAKAGTPTAEAFARLRPTVLDPAEPLPVVEDDEE